MSQTGNIASNDAFLVRLFITCLKDLAIDWSMRLQPGTIETFSHLESLFLVRFFDDKTEAVVPTLLQTKHLKDEPPKVFIERFRDLALHYPSGMTIPTLVQTCSYKFQMKIFTQIGITECTTW